MRPAARENAAAARQNVFQRTFGRSGRRSVHLSTHIVFERALEGFRR
jgi:hypothetical protein